MVTADIYITSTITTGRADQAQLQQGEQIKHWKEPGYAAASRPSLSGR